MDKTLARYARAHRSDPDNEDLHLRYLNYKARAGEATPSDIRQRAILAGEINWRQELADYIRNNLQTPTSDYSSRHEMSTCFVACMDTSGSMPESTARHVQRQVRDYLNRVEHVNRTVNKWKESR